MTFNVFADLILSNGERPTTNTTVRLDNGLVKFNFGEVKFSVNLKIMNGTIELNFTPLSNDYKFWDNWDNIFELAKIIIDPIVLTSTLHLGQGLIYIINRGSMESADIVTPNIDTAKEPQFDLTVSRNAESVAALIASNFRLKFAVRDFNDGLLDRKDCAFYFYREIETLAKLIGEIDGKKTNWCEFYKNVGASEEEISQLIDKTKFGTIRYSADKLRHGVAPGSIDRSNWEDMKKVAKALLIKSIKYLLDSNDHLNNRL